MASPEELGSDERIEELVANVRLPNAQKKKLAEKVQQCVAARIKKIVDDLRTSFVSNLGPSLMFVTGKACSPRLTRENKFTK